MLLNMSPRTDISFCSSKGYKTFSTRSTSTRCSASSWERSHLLVVSPLPPSSTNTTPNKCGELEGQGLQASQDALPAPFLRKSDSTALLVQETRVELVVEPSELHVDLQRLKDESIDTDYDCPDEEHGLIHVDHRSLTQTDAGPDETQIMTASKWDSAEDDRVLGEYYQDKENIVLDSVSPELTPHIVVTTTPDSWSEQSVAWLNRVDPQCPDDLMVPLSDLSEKVAGLQPPVSDSDHTPSTSEQVPKAVLSHSKFNAMVKSCSNERSSPFLVNLMTALHRHIWKVNALHASHVALSYRRRYDAELPFSRVEKPFIWTDPAEPILSSSRFDYNTMIIDSPNPFCVPHIIINSAPPEDPWVTWSNSVNNPQDRGFGRYLTVPARGVYYANEPDDYFDGYETYHDGDESLLDDVYIDCDDENEDDYGEHYISTLEAYCVLDEDATDIDTESVGSIDSFIPQTPDEEADFKAAFERALARRIQYDVDQGLEVVEEEDEYAEFSLTHCDNATEAAGVDADKVCQPFDHEEQMMATADAWAWGDEDEDELPPLDEWYQSVMRRTQNVLEVRC